MKKETAIIFVAALAAIFFVGAVTYRTILKRFFPTWENFSSTPYWDYKQWSWGYGTRVPGSVDDRNIKPAGSIDRVTAMFAALRHVDNDYNYLKQLIKVPLTGSQWAAVLSFSYNLGPGSADNLIYNINAKDLPALKIQWNEYIYADGQPLQKLIDRRAAEWRLFTS